MFEFIDVAKYCINPIFVVGCPRSGTSVLAHSIGRHPRAWRSAESDFLIPLIRSLKEIHQFGSTRGDKHWLSREGVSAEEFLRFVGYGVNALYTERSGAKRWVEQTPAYALHAPDLVTTFPGAQFVNIVRDGREVVNSMIHSNFDTRWARDFSKACQTWVEYIEAARQFEAGWPGKMITVRNEVMSAEPARVMGKMLDFLGLPMAPRTVDLLVSGDRINSSFAKAERKKTHWEKSWSEEDKRTFEQTCAGTMARLGYS